VVVEPIQAEAGIIEPEDAFLQKLRKRCDETGTLLILDEVQTGMGRTGKLFAFEHYGVVPDILCLAKSFGGGMPLGAFIAPREMMKELTYDPPLGHITTFGGHPVSCAAGLAAQTAVEKEDLMSHALAMEQLYREELKHPLITGIRGRGLFLAAVLREGVKVADFISGAFENGLVIDQFLFSADAFRIAPPLVITAEEVRDSVQRIIRTLDTLEK
jgi:acetylornithine/succinyldiaminopimelate/putrescine aminotransferase